MANKKIKGKTVLAGVSSKRSGGQIECSKVKVALGQVRKIFEWIRDEEKLTITVDGSVAAITTITSLTARLNKMKLEYCGGDITDEQYESVLEMLKRFGVDGFYLKYSGFEVTPKQSGKLVGMVQNKDEVEIVIEQNQAELEFDNPEASRKESDAGLCRSWRGQKPAKTAKEASDVAQAEKEAQKGYEGESGKGKTESKNGKKQVKAKKTAEKKKVGGSGQRGLSLQ